MAPPPASDPIPVRIEFLTHESRHEPGFAIAATRAVCSVCGVAGWAPGHAARSVVQAIAAMRSGCLGNEPGRRRYVGRPDEHPPRRVSR